MLILSILLSLLLIGGKIFPSILINRIIILSIGYAMIFITILIKIIEIKNIIQSISIYSNLYQITKIELFVKTLLYFGAFIISLLGEIKTKKGNILKSAEYNILIILSLLGMITLIESNDIISIFLSIELTSFPLYILASLYNYNTSGLGINKDSQSGIKAGLKYLLLGSFTSTMLLGGLIILYSTVGLTNLNEIGICINVGISANYAIFGILLVLISRIIITGFIFTLSGLLFKIGSVPFHNWAPDVYDGMPTIVTSWVSILPKISFITIMGNLNTLIFRFINKSNFIFLLTSFGSLIIGSIVGLGQYRIKRLLTYSSITQIGFILLGFSIKESSSLLSILFYLIQYTLTSICVFLILMSLYKFFNLEVISQFKNLFNFNSLLCFSLMICFFSFAGIPPFVGFFGKLNILKQSIHFGYYFLTFIAIFTSIISAGYYLRIIKLSHFDLTTTKSSNVHILTPNLTGNITINNFISMLTIFIISYVLLFNINLNLYNLTLISTIIPIIKLKKKRQLKILQITFLINIIIISSLIFFIIDYSINNVTLIKILIIILLMLFNILFLYNEIISENNKNLYIKNGQESNLIKSIGRLIVITTGFYSSYTTINDRNKTFQETDKIYKDLIEKNKEIQKNEGIILDLKEKFNVLIVNLQETTKLLNSNVNNLFEINNRLKSLKENKEISNSKILNEIKLLESDRGYYTNELKSNLANLNQINKELENIPINKIIKSSFFNPSEIFENLNEYQQIAISLLICNQVIFSSLITIIFIFYGDYLIQRFDIENKYPRLYKFISLRRKFQKYYLLISIGWILLILIIESIFAISLLSI